MDKKPVDNNSGSKDDNKAGEKPYNKEDFTSPSGKVRVYRRDENGGIVYNPTVDSVKGQAFVAGMLAGFMITGAAFFSMFFNTLFGMEADTRDASRTGSVTAEQNCTELLLKQENLNKRFAEMSMGKKGESAFEMTMESCLSAITDVSRPYEGPADNNAEEGATVEEGTSKEGATIIEPQMPPSLDPGIEMPDMAPEEIDIEIILPNPKLPVEPPAKDQGNIKPETDDKLPVNNDDGNRNMELMLDLEKGIIDPIDIEDKRKVVPQQPLSPAPGP
jgi:hypothetical protein